MYSTQETPPDLYTFISWHLRGAYRECHLADDVWKKLREVASVEELRHHMKNPSRIDIKIHSTVRDIFRLAKYQDELAFLEPSPHFVGETLADFLRFYNTTRDGIVEKTDDSGIDSPTTDNHLTAEAFDQDNSEIDARPPAPKGDSNTPAVDPPKRGRGRPKKQPVAA